MNIYVLQTYLYEDDYYNDFGVFDSEQTALEHFYRLGRLKLVELYGENHECIKDFDVLLSDSDKSRYLNSHNLRCDIVETQLNTTFSFG